MKIGMKKGLKPRNLLFFPCLLLLSLSIGPLAAAERGKEPTVEDLSRSLAAELYFAKRYTESLAEFEKLEAEHSGNLIIKRYIVTLLDELGRPKDVAEKLKEILKLDPNDSVAREKVTALERRSAVTMDVEDFVASAPSQNFSIGRYEEALAGFDELLKKYPQDILIRRFRGVTLLRLKRTDEAVHAMEETLQSAPRNVALHYYLAQAYRQQGREDAARKEFQWVIRAEDADYTKRAQQALFQPEESRKKDKEKRWGAQALTGYEFDTNATFKSSDDDYSKAGDKNSGRYPLNLSGYYRFYKIRRWLFTTDAFYAQNISNDFPRLNTYTYGGGLSALYRFRLFRRPAFLNFREGASQTFLKNRFYTWADSLSTTLVHDLHKRFRFAATYRWAVHEFDPDGSNPKFTRRDGISNAVSLTGTFYFSRKQNFYLSSGYDYEIMAAEGNNYRKHLHGTHLRVHLPLLKKIEGEVEFRFKESDYPKYGFAPPKRKDDVFIFIAALERPIVKGLRLIGRYTFEDSKARNNLYEYIRQIFAVHLAYRY